MALLKVLQVFGTTNKTVYCVLQRTADGYFLQTTLASFAAEVVYLPMTEDADVKGLYALSTGDVAWPDGSYVVAVYQQVGNDPAPSADLLIAGDVPKVVSDALVQLDGSVAAMVSQVNGIAADLETTVTGSDPPVTRVQMLERLYIPEYVAPVVVQPVGTDPDTQNLHFRGVNGDNTPATGRVSAVPAEGQVVETSLISKQKLEAVLNGAGYATLILVRGVKYRVSAPWWRTPVDILITADADRNIVQYL